MSSQVNFQGGKVIKKSQKNIFGGKADIYNQHQINVLRGGLKNNQDNLCITTTTAAASGTTTSLTVAAPTHATIRKGDKLIIVGKTNGGSQTITAAISLSGTDTTLHISSVSLAPFEAGSYIMFNNQDLNRRIAGGLFLSIVDLDNAAYQALGTTEQTLVSADANSYIFPVQIWIEVNGYVSSGETVNKNLYIRYNGGDSTNYLGTISSFNRGGRADSTWIVPLTGTSSHKIQSGSVHGEALEIQASGDFASTDFTLRIFTQYQLIGY